MISPSFSFSLVENFARCNTVFLCSADAKECLASRSIAWRIICIKYSTRHRDVGICPSCSLISRVNESLVFLKVHVVRERRQPVLSHSVDASERAREREEKTKKKEFEVQSKLGHSQT